MIKKKRREEKLPVVPPEKHPLEQLPEMENEPILSEEDLDKIPGEEEEEENPKYEPPPPGEGP